MRCLGSSRDALETDNAAFALLMWNEKIIVDVSFFSRKWLCVQKY